MVAAYPRTGSTWLRFLLYGLLSGESATFASVDRRIPDVGRGDPVPLLPGGGRLLKTHEPYLAAYGRGIYMVRDARDVVVSEYHFQRMVGRFAGSLEEFVSRFLDGSVNSYGAWHEHVQGWLDSRTAAAGWLHVVRYEDLKREPAETLLSIADFLGVTCGRPRVDQVVEDNTVERMREKEEAGGGELPGSREEEKFVREGRAGGWPSSLSGRQVRAIEAVAGPVLRRLEYPVGPGGDA